MAQQTVAARFHVKNDDEEGGSANQELENGHWTDIS
jgi:hypothetical protein